MQIWVVVDVHALDRLEIDAIEGVELSVSDHNGIGRRDAGSKCKLLKTIEMSPLDGVNGGQLGKA